MANRIKGITVEIGGDTTQLDRALKDVNKELKTTQGDLREVERLLKLDPSNVTLLGQKQRELASAIDTTGKKLDTLKAAAAQANKKLELGEITISQYETLQREVIATERALKELKDQAKDTERRLDKTAAALKDVGDKADGVSEKTKGLTAAVAGIGAAAVAAIPATEEFRESMGKLAVNVEAAGASIDKADSNFKKFFAVTNEVDSSVEALSNLLQTGFDDNQIAAAVDALSGAVVRFPDTLKIESLADSLQETIATGAATGQFAELLDRLGIGADSVTESIKNLTVEQRKWVAIDILARSGLAETAQEWANTNQTLVESRNAEVELKSAMSDLAESIMPLVTQVTELGTAFINWFNSLSSGGQASIVTLLALAAAVSPLAGLISNVSNIMANASAIFTVANAKIMAVVVAVGLLVAGILAVASVWDKMTGAQKVITVLTTLAAAATTAAIAIGIFHASATMGFAAAGIAAGIAAITAAVLAAQGSAKRAASNAAAPITNYGGGTPYTANTAQTSYTGGYQSQQSRNQTVILQMDGATMARGMMPYLDGENQRRGVQIAGGS